MVKKWAAIPDADGRPQNKVNVNIYSKPAPQLVQAPAPAPSHMGFTAKQAQKDLNSYFDTIDNQIHNEEKKEAESQLQRLGVTLPSQGTVLKTRAQPQQQQSARPAEPAEASPSTVAAQKERSLYALIRKAMNSEEFQRALVSA